MLFGLSQKILLSAGFSPDPQDPQLKAEITASVKLLFGDLRMAPENHQHLPLCPYAAWVLIYSFLQPVAPMRM